MLLLLADPVANVPIASRGVVKATGKVADELLPLLLVTPPCLSSDCYPVERGPIVVIVGVIKAAFCERVYR